MHHLKHRLATKDVQENLQNYVRGSIPAGGKWILFTKCIRQVWEKVSANKEMVIRSFWKRAIPGSKDDEINLNSPPNYKVGDSEVNEIELDDESMSMLVWPI